MSGAVPRLLALVGSSLLLGGCAASFGKTYLHELEVVRDPCPDATIGALRSQVPTFDFALAIPAQVARADDFDAGLEALGQIEALATPVDGQEAVPAAQSQLLTAAAQSLLEDRELLSFGAARHVEAVERGAIAATAAQAFAAGAGATNTVSLSRDAWQASADDIWNATVSEGWGSAAVASIGQLRRARAARLSAQGAGLAAASNEERLAQAAALRRSLLFLYFKAYFRNGRILAVSVSSEAMKAGLKDRLARTIKDDTLRKAVESEIDTVADDVVKLICKDAGGQCLALGLIGESTFVTRAGKSFGFPGIEAKIDPFADKKISTNKIDKDAVIGDLVRIFFEAVGDAQFAVPAVKSSTACKYQLHCATDEQNKLLPKVDSIADKVEAGTTALTGVAVRGGWLASLNNEALATAIQTGVGVTFRKGAEKAAWSIVSKRCPAVSRAPFETVELRLSR